ncbi:MAG: glycosyltransferase family 4 protein [Verrucomicrobiales bacterium]
MNSSSSSHRILFVIARGDAFGGSSLHVMDMASQLEMDGHKVKIVVGGTEDMEVPRRFAVRNLNFVCLPALRREIDPLNDLKAVRGIRACIRDFAPDMISLHASKAGTLGRLAAVGSGIPVVYTPHCWSFVDGFPKANLFRRLEKFLAPLAARIVTVCEDERKFGLARGVGRPSRTIAIHNGVKDAFGGRTKARPVPGAPVRILMVGRFEQQKNQELLIRALAKLADLDWTLTLVGEGPFRDRCRDLATEFGLDGRVDFAGYSSRVDRHLESHDLFALVTNWEGFPRSILEAMSASLPVLVSDVGGSRESVVDGKTGRLVPPSDEAALVETLRELLTDPEELWRMGQAGRQRYAERFTFETMYANYTTLYERLVPRARKPRRMPFSPARRIRRFLEPFPPTPAKAVAGDSAGRDVDAGRR